MLHIRTKPPPAPAGRLEREVSGAELGRAGCRSERERELPGTELNREIPGGVFGPGVDRAGGRAELDRVLCGTELGRMGRGATREQEAPAAGLERNLFENIDELRARHGQGAGTGERMLHAAGAVFACAVLFGALYALILFLE